MITQEHIVRFCEKHDYDVRVSHNARWIDQKCAADVVSVIADCILNYVLENDDSFTVYDIWHYSYSVNCVESLFKKPRVEEKQAKHEYDKFFAQPITLLAYAGVLSKVKQGKGFCYRIEDFEVLEYISIRERNALFFLKTYIEKVLRDSGIYNKFEEFFAKQTQDAYQTVKEAFSTFTIHYTSINGKTECDRMFIKVLNPLAYYHNSCGTERGKISKNPITFDMLMYNRNNFRDIYANKPKGMTRKEYAETHQIPVNTDYYRYQSTKAKNLLRRFNVQFRNGRTEHLDNKHVLDNASHMHHIFPEAEFPEICSYLENLIALTPTQHLNYAHPNGKTQEISDQFQHLLLLSKADRIRENLESLCGEIIYSFSDFLYVLCIGFDDKDILSITNMDFETVINTINLHYSV